MRERNSSCRRVYEYPDATVIVRPPLCGILDGLIKANFSCEVHPANGGAVHKYLKLPAFYAWQAGQLAVERYRELSK